MRSRESSPRAGRLFTQQIGANFWKELLEFFPRARPGSGRLFERYVRGLENAGLVITRAEEHDTNVAFRSLGDLGYMLAVTPWTIPGFDLDRDLDTLLALERSLKRDDGIVLTEGFFAIEARKDTVKDR